MMNDHAFGEPQTIEIPLRRVSIETPYCAATEEQLKVNIRYADDCMRHSITMGESPFASHLLYTRILDDNKLNERVAGLALGHAWRLAAQAIIVYVDLGISEGMNDAVALAEANDIPVVYRRLYTVEKGSA